MDGALDVDGALVKVLAAIAAAEEVGDVASHRNEHLLGVAGSFCGRGRTQCTVTKASEESDLGSITL